MYKKLVAHIAYNKDTLVLRVTLTNRHVFEYYGVPDAIAHQFLSVPNKDQYFIHNIKDQFGQHRVL